MTCHLFATKPFFTNSALLLIGALWFSEMWIKNTTIFVKEKEKNEKITSENRQPHCIGLNVLRCIRWRYHDFTLSRWYTQINLSNIIHSNLALRPMCLLWNVFIVDNFRVLLPWPWKRSRSIFVRMEEFQTEEFQQYRQMPLFLFGCVWYSPPVRLVDFRRPVDQHVQRRQLQGTMVEEPLWVVQETLWMEMTVCEDLNRNYRDIQGIWILTFNELQTSDNSLAL